MKNNWTRICLFVVLLLLFLVRANNPSFTEEAKVHLNTLPLVFGNALTQEYMAVYPLSNGEFMTLSINEEQADQLVLDYNLAWLDVVNKR